MRPAHGSRAVWAAILIFFGLFFTINALFDISSGAYVAQKSHSETLAGSEEKNPPTLGVLLSILAVIGLLPLGGGVYMIKTIQDMKIEYSRSLARWSQSSVIRVAAMNNGKVTVEQTSAYMGINPDESRTILDDMTLSGNAEIAVDDEGVFVYLVKGASGASGNIEKVDN
jgi:hypothetical protein